MTKHYKEATLIIEAAYLSSIVSAHTSPTGKVSTSAPYNFNSFIDLIVDLASVERIDAVTYCDALPFNDANSEISQQKIARVKKFHNFLRGQRVKVKLGRTEKIEGSFKQTGVNTSIVDSMCYYHDRYDDNEPIILVSADRSLQSTISRLQREKRDIILVGSDCKEKNLYYKDEMIRCGKTFINLTTEDVLKFKDSPKWKEKQKELQQTLTT